MQKLERGAGINFRLPDPPGMLDGTLPPQKSRFYSLSRSAGEGWGEGRCAYQCSTIIWQSPACLNISLLRQLQ